MSLRAAMENAAEILARIRRLGSLATLPARYAKIAGIILKLT